VSRSKKIEPTEGCWRDIRQSASRKVVTAHARRRLLLFFAKGVFVFLLLLGAAASSWYGYIHYREGVDRMQTVRSAQPLKEILYQTDGVLTREWVAEQLGLELGADVMALDIHAKKLQLESFGQVRGAVLRRQPERLVINVRERFPVARVAAREEGGVTVLLVDREGVVYRGFGYRKAELDSMPFLGGVSLRRSEGQYLPLKHMDVVADLLITANEHTPHLVPSWRVIDCSELPALITVRSREIEEIIFSRDQMAPQLRRLDMIVAENRRQMTGQKRVDLSLGNQVVVR